MWTLSSPLKSSFEGRIALLLAGGPSAQTKLVSKSFKKSFTIAMVNLLICSILNNGWIQTNELLAFSHVCMQGVCHSRGIGLTYPKLLALSFQACFPNSRWIRKQWCARNHPPPSPPPNFGIVVFIACNWGSFNILAKFCLRRPGEQSIIGAKPSVTIRCFSMTQKHFRLFCNKCKWQTRGQGWSQGQRLVSNLYFLFMSCCNNFERMKEISRNVRQGNVIRKLVHSFSDLFLDLLWNSHGARILRWCKSINGAVNYCSRDLVFLFNDNFSSPSPPTPQSFQPF